MLLCMLVNQYQLLVIKWNLFGFFRMFYIYYISKIFSFFLNLFRRTKSLSESRINELKQILKDMGADIDSVASTKQDC